ncbi:unnamed protein product [Wickerhamomyces anomalus]
MSKVRDCVTSHSLFTKSRLYSLYSDFRKLKEVNPYGYEANMIAWKSLVDTFFQKQVLKDIFVLSTDGLLEELTLAEYGKPMSLDLVLDELIATGDLIPIKQYKQRTDSIYSRKWIRPMLSWTVNRFIYDTSYKIGDRKHQLKSDKLISKNLLEDYVKELENKTALENLSTHSRNVFTKFELLSYLNALNIHLYGKIVNLSDLDYDIFLTYLERDVHKVKVKGDIVKFGSDEVTEEDESIAEIKSTLKSLNSKTEELQQKLDNVSLRLKESLRNKNNKDLSLNLLRSKKLAEKSLSTQLSLTNQLESVMYKIDESSSNVQLLKALENGTVILKSLNSQIGGVERVEKIMDDLEEETYQNDKIAAEFNRLDTQVDDSEIEAEFEEMLSQEKGRQKSEHYTESSENELLDKLQELKLAPNEIDPKSEKKVEREALHN